MATPKPHQKKHIGPPKMTARKNWRNYLLGMGTEVLYVLAVIAVSFLIAALMWVIYR